MNDPACLFCRFTLAETVILCLSENASWRLKVVMAYSSYLSLAQLDSIKKGDEG